MKHIVKIAAIAAASLLALSATSSAAVLLYEFNLDGAQSGNLSSGTGFASVTLDTVSNELNWDIDFTGLTGTLSNSHFHGPAAPGVSNGVLVGIPMGDASGQNAGTITGMAIIDDTVKSHIIDGLSYINLHSTTFGGGEIRGQVIPEPGTYALMAGMVALGGAAWFRRRKA